VTGDSNTDAVGARLTGQDVPGAVAPELGVVEIE
jgi:hypothetical protein